jgi:Zn-dependent protease
MDFSLLDTIALAALPVILAITLHEAAHGYVARKFGDSTAWMLGRVTLNPLKHIDPIGTVVVPLGILLLSGGGFLFGWAKPVPVNFGNLRHPKRDMLWVAAAGPGVNFVMALVWALVFGVATGGGVLPSAALKYMSLIGVGINVSLMVLNLLPILPLDGGRIAVSLLPHSLAVPFARTERFGFFIVIALLASGALGVAMRPLVNGATTLIELLTGVDLPGGF